MDPNNTNDDGSANPDNQGASDKTKTMVSAEQFNSLMESNRLLSDEITALKAANQQRTDSAAAAEAQSLVDQNKFKELYETEQANTATAKAASDAFRKGIAAQLIESKIRASLGSKGITDTEKQDDLIPALTRKIGASMDDKGVVSGDFETEVTKAVERWGTSDSAQAQDKKPGQGDAFTVARLAGSVRPGQAADKRPISAEEYTRSNLASALNQTH